VHISSNNNNINALLNPHCTALSLLPFLLAGVSSSFHVPQTAHGSRTTTLNARTPTRELHARSLACLPKKPSSFQAPSYPRSPPQLGQGKAKQIKAVLLHCCIAIGTGTAPAQHARERNARKQARQSRQADLAINQSHARRKEGQAGQVATRPSRPNFHSSIHSACECMRILHCRCSPNHQKLHFPRSGACTCTTSSKRMAALARALPRTCPRQPSCVLRRCLGATCD
jgi:hypothetical protein